MKIKAVALIILASLLCMAPKLLLADVVLIHGSLAQDEDWYRPSDNPNKGLFYKELSYQAKRLGLGKVIPFSWSGRSGLGSRKSGVREHIKAAEALTKLIRDGFAADRPEGAIQLNGPLYLVGHSNGGVVSEIASHMLYNPNSDESEKKSSSTASVAVKGPEDGLSADGPTLDLSRKGLLSTASSSNKTADTVDYTSRIEKDHYASLLEKKINKVTLHCRQLLLAAINRARSTYGVNDRVQIKIAQLIMIATPIDRSLYSVNMRVVDRVCALFSSGDGLQRFFGRTRYPQGPNAMNFRVAIKTLAGGIYYPLHTQMRHQCIARYLLELMSDASKVINTTPVKFGAIPGIDVLVDEHGESPSFEIIKNLKIHAFPASGLDE